MNKKIVVFGLGYVGLSNALSLAKYNEVVGIDINKNLVDKLNNGTCPFDDESIKNYLINENINFSAFVINDSFVSCAEFALICVPTNFNEKLNSFDTSIIESIILDIENKNPSCIIVIKSTIPIGYTNELVSKYKNIKLLFSPEFLREGKALQDNLLPSRIVIGADLKRKESIFCAELYLDLVKEYCQDKNVKSFIIDYKEAESVKLFSNAYLAMRVSFFNELDTFCESLNMSSKNVITSVCADNRIGNYYNNPSYGYGGYCLPKDTKQLKSDFDKNKISTNLFPAIIESNYMRKEYIIDKVLKNTNSKDIIGIYRLSMKTNSDNCRSSSILDIINSLSKKRKIIVYEPKLQIQLNNVEIVNKLDKFKIQSKLILANRFNDDLVDVKEKVYTRDIFNNN